MVLRSVCATYIYLSREYLFILPVFQVIQLPALFKAPFSFISTFLEDDGESKGFCSLSEDIFSPDSPKESKTDLRFQNERKHLSMNAVQQMGDLEMVRNDVFNNVASFQNNQEVHPREAFDLALTAVSFKRQPEVQNCNKISKF